MKRKYKITFNSPVVLSFAAACLVVMLINYVTSGVSNQVSFMTYHSSPPYLYNRCHLKNKWHGIWTITTRINEPS